MRRPGVLAVSTALLLTVAACGDGEQPSAGGEPAAGLPGPFTPALAEVPAGFTPPEAFDATSGFALRTGAGEAARGDGGRDTYEVTAFGLASYVVDDAGVAAIESVDLAGEGQWRLEVRDPLKSATRYKPSLVSVVGEGATWLALIEHGTETGPEAAAPGPVTRVSTYNAETGAIGGRATVDGVDRYVSHLGPNLVAYLEDQNTGEVSTVVVDPATGVATRHDPVAVQEGEDAWIDTVIDTYRGQDLVVRQCADESFFSSCPSGLLYGGQWVEGSDVYGVSQGLVVTPGGATVGSVDLATGKELGDCDGSQAPAWSPSGRYATVGGRVVDFSAGTAVCVGYYPILTALDDLGVAYGAAENGDRVRMNTVSGQLKVLPENTVLPQGIGAGGYGVFRTDTAVVVLPPR